MKASNEIKEFIKEIERFEPYPYRCPANKLTIGYGHLYRIEDGIVPPITEEQASELLDRKISSIETALKLIVEVPLLQTQYDALVSFAYNLGVSALANSTLLKLINQKKFLIAADQFLRWKYITLGNGEKKALDGLLSRRKKERRLFLSIPHETKFNHLISPRTDSGSGNN
jgi:lysozyme